MQKLFLFALVLLCSCEMPERYYLFFEDAEGMTDRTKIYLEGEEIGKATALNLVKGGALMEFRLLDEYKIPRGATFYSKPLGPVGYRVVEISRGRGDGFYQPYDTIREDVIKIGIREAMENDSISRQKADTLQVRMKENFRRLRDHIDEDFENEK